MTVKIMLTLAIIVLNAFGIGLILAGSARLDDERRGFLCFGCVSVLCSWAFTAIFLIGGILL